MALTETHRYLNQIPFLSDRQRPPLPSRDLYRHSSEYEESRRFVEHTLQAFPHLQDGLMYGVDPVRARENAIAQLIRLHEHHPYSYEHSLKVALGTQTHAELFGLSPALLARAGKLHDVGKVTVPRYLLDAPEGYSMTDEEKALLKGHVGESMDMLRKYHEDRDVLLTVGAHHQFNDHEGRIPYPANPLPNPGTKEYPAQILLALCDSVDAMMTDRGYQPKLPPLDARNVVEKVFGERVERLCHQPRFRNRHIEPALVFDLAVEAKLRIDDAYAQIAA